MKTSWYLYLVGRMLMLPTGGRSALLPTQRQRPSQQMITRLRLAFSRNEMRDTVSIVFSWYPTIAYFNLSAARNVTGYAFYACYLRTLIAIPRDGSAYMSLIYF
ncbi:hypothetical protein EV127DRAFT_423759 [Xylaria flabelliformis]|nr:hypothetical protein EV127DRAFT_423759 [Xylaria flabelliformis]